MADSELCHEEGCCVECCGMANSLFRNFASEACVRACQGSQGDQCSLGFPGSIGGCAVGKSFLESTSLANLPNYHDVKSDFPSSLCCLQPQEQNVSLIMGSCEFGFGTVDDITPKGSNSDSDSFYEFLLRTPLAVFSFLGFVMLMVLIVVFNVVFQLRKQSKTNERSSSEEDFDLSALELYAFRAQDEASL